MASIAYNKEKLRVRLAEVQERFCKTFGVEPKEIVVDEFDEDKEFKELFEYQKKETKKELGRGLNQLEEIDAWHKARNIVTGWSQGLNGRFKSYDSTKVFIYPEHIEDDLCRKSVMVHESLHGVIHDYLQGISRKDKIITFHHPDFDAEFAKRLMQEQKYKDYAVTAIYRVSPHQMTELFQYTSFEERFIIYNTLCYMLKEEFDSGRPKPNNVMTLVDEYIGSLGLLYDNLQGLEVRNTYNGDKPTKLGNLLSEVYDICENSPETIKNFERTEKIYPVESIELEERESIVPQIVEELVSFRVNTESKDAWKRKAGEIIDKYKRFGADEGDNHNLQTADYIRGK